MGNEKLYYCPFWDIFWAGGATASGAVIYVLKFPEKWFPRTFDKIGNSHNLFHFAVMFGVYKTWKASL